MRAAADVGAAGLMVATLSLDEEINRAYPWRWFCAAGWHSNAVMHTLDPRPRPGVRVAETDPA